MNFEDPFADDLNNFRSVAAGLRQSASSPAASNASHGRGGATTSLASPLPSSSSTRGQFGAASAGLGTTSPILGSGTSGVSIFPSAANPAPVAGRRARATPSSSSPLSVTPSNVPPSIPSVTPGSPLSQPPAPAPPLSTQLTQKAPQGQATFSALSWLDDMDAIPAGTARRGTPASLQPSASQPASSSPSVAAGTTNVPSFLNFDTGDGVSDAAPPPPEGTPSQRVASPASTTSITNTAAAEAEKRKSELRDLYAALDALDAEQQRLDERLDTRQLKEETELLALETTVMKKTNELADKEDELAAKHTELATLTAERLDALANRYAREMEAQSAEVRTLDGARFEKQLQQVVDRCTTVAETVNGLREQAALAMTMEPFSEKGVRVALATAAASTASSSTPATARVAEGGEAENGVSSTSLEWGLQTAVNLLRAYCDQRLGHARKRLVDYVHTETLEAAHSVRRKREQSWADDAVQHKTLFSQYMTDMMQRYMAFYKERALLKQQNITSLQGELQATAAELRDRAAMRLQTLLKDVTARMTLSTEHQAKSAEETKNGLQRKSSAVCEADTAMAAAQRKEMESRLLAEAQARRQRFQAEEQSLLDQLERLRRSNETSAHVSFQALLDSAESSGPSHAQSLEEEVAALKARVSEKLFGGGASSELRSASSTAHMHAEELSHVVRRALAEESARQGSLSLSRQRCSNLRDELLQCLQEVVVERLQHVRCVQHGHQSRIDAQRKAWEAAHRQNLAAACSLILPISGSTAGVEDALLVTETYAAPRDVASIALMDVVHDKLQSRDEARRRLLQSRKEYSTRCLRLLDGVRMQQETVHTTWEDLWGAAQTLLTQQSAVHEMRLEVEKGLITVTAQQQTVARDHRHAEREHHRIAGVTQRLKAEAAQCGVDDRLLCAPPELLDADGGSLPAVVTVPPPPSPPSTSTTSLRTVEPSTINRLPVANKFTAVHTSTNVAAALSKADAAIAAGVVPSPTSTAVPSQPLPTTAAPEIATGLRRTPQDDTSNVVDASNATATQPWSSALLRAEQLPSSSNAHLPTGGPQQPTSVASDLPQDGTNDDVRHGSQRSGVRPADDSAAEDSGEARSWSTTSPSTATDEKRRSSSSARFAEPAAQPGSSTWLDSDVAPQQSQQQRLRVPTSSQWQLPRPPGRGSNTFETWSILEEYRSGVERTASAVREQDVSGDGTTFSFDDSTSFIDLLSCTDSPASSYRTR